MKAIVAFLTAVFAFATNAEAGEIQFAFHTEVPLSVILKGEPAQRLVKVAEKEISADVDISGLPIVRNQRMAYVTYAKPVPDSWLGKTITWYEPSGPCSVVHAHVAIIAGRGEQLVVLYNELFQLGFKRAIERAGIDNWCTRKVKGLDPEKTFLYAGRVWTERHLVEASSEIGVMRAAKKLNQPQIVQERFRQAAQHNSDGYALIHFLIKRSGNDPQRYEAELKLAIESFLDRYRKK